MSRSDSIILGAFIFIVFVAAVMFAWNNDPSTNGVAAQCREDYLDTPISQVPVRCLNAFGGLR